MSKFHCIHYFLNFIIKKIQKSKSISIEKQTKTFELFLILRFDEISLKVIFENIL